MTVTITRTPRTAVLLRANECINPRLGSYSNWQSSGDGNGSANNTYSAAGGTLEKYWTTAPSSVENAGWYYDQFNQSPGVQKTYSADIYYQGWEPNVVGKVFFYNGNQLIGTVVGTPVQTAFDTANTGWRRVAVTATSPTGTTRLAVQFCAIDAGGHRPPQGQGMALRRVLIEPGSTAGTYFDGSTYATGNGTQFTTWEGTADASRSLLWDANPADVTIPALSEGWDQVNPGRNGFLELLDNTTAVVLQPVGARRGVFKLYFGGYGISTAAARASAVACAALLGSGSLFTYSDNDMPNVAAFTFALDTAGVRLYVAESRLSWRVDVAYLEVV